MKKLLMHSDEEIHREAMKAYHQGDMAASADLLAALIVKAPSDCVALSRVAFCLVRAGRLEYGCRLAIRSAEIDRGNFRIHKICVGILFSARRFLDAKYIVDRAICLAPDHADSWLDNAEWCLQFGDISGAQESIEYSVRLERESYRGIFLLAVLERRIGNWEKSIDLFTGLLRRKPELAELHYQIGRNHFASNNFSGAANWYSRAIIRSPQTSEYYFGLSLCKFILFDFIACWRLHDHRLYLFREELGTVAGARYLEDCRWYTGSSRYQRVLVWSDEGVGDQIKYGSLLRELDSQVGELRVQLDTRLLPLFQRSVSNDVVFHRYEVRVREEDYDAHIAIGSLGQYLRPSRESFLGKGDKFLWADPVRVLGMQELLAREPEERVVGISWRSSNPETGEERSVALEDLVRIFAKQGVRLVNLQYGEVDSELASVRRTTGIEVWRCPGLDTTNDLDGLAALIEACDEVVSIGNTTAHLAGALGKKTTVILRRAPNWRWLEQAGQSLWYRSARVITWTDGV